VDGLIHGTLRCQGSAIIGETGLVQGDVYSVDLLVIGKLEGNVYAENLHLHATASISGDISARTLQVDPGAHFSGTVTMRDEAAIAAEHRLAHEFREPAPIAATEHPPLESPLESPLVLVETQPDLHTITLPLEEQKPGKKRA
ncbi:MAG: polymer-forming cytoskeletal protein, partial [Burkholderiaceae bacterium]|nr:polymer-forming cytoskeletal protein [Burkholderiaceae bacterium]